MYVIPSCYQGNYMFSHYRQLCSSNYLSIILFIGYYSQLEDKIEISRVKSSQRGNDRETRGENLSHIKCDLHTVVNLGVCEQQAPVYGFLYVKLFFFQDNYLPLKQFLNLLSIDFFTPENVIFRLADTRQSYCTVFTKFPIEAWLF